jgi:hypothetical protein
VRRFHLQVLPFGGGSDVEFGIFRFEFVSVVLLERFPHRLFCLQVMFLCVPFLYSIEIGAEL